MDVLTLAAESYGTDETLLLRDDLLPIVNEDGEKSELIWDEDQPQSSQGMVDAALASQASGSADDSQQRQAAVIRLIQRKWGTHVALVAVTLWRRTASSASLETNRQRGMTLQTLVAAVRLQRQRLDEKGGAVNALVSAAVSASRPAAVEHNKTMSVLPGVAALSLKRVKEALIVLIQHGLVAFTETEDDRILYHVKGRAFENLLRYPRMLAWIRLRYDAVAYGVTETLLEHGKLTVADLANAVVSVFGFENGAVQTVLYRLVMDRILCPLDEKGERVTFVPVIAQKRKLTESDSLKESLDASLYLIVDTETLLKMLFMEDLIDFAVARWSPCARLILEAFIQAMGTSWLDVGKGQAPPLKIDVQFTHLLRYLSDLSVLQKYYDPRSNMKPQPFLREVLSLFCSGDCAFMTMVDAYAGGGTFRLDFMAIQRLLQRHQVECIVTERYGSASCRLLRILWHKQQMEEKQLCQMAMMNGKETKERMHTLFRQGLARLQEIGKTPDHAAARTFFLWHSHVSLASHVLSQRVMKALGRLCARQCLLRRQHSVLLQKLQRQDVAGNGSLLSDAERHVYEQVARQWDALMAMAIALERVYTQLQDQYWIKGLVI